MQSILSSLPELIGTVFAWRIVSKPLRVLLRLALQAIVGVGALFAAFLAGFPVVPSAASAAVCAVFGLPGAALILGLSILL